MPRPLVQAANPYSGNAESDHNMIITLRNYFIGFCVHLLGLCSGNGHLKKAKLKKGQWALFKQRAKTRNLSKKQVVWSKLDGDRRHLSRTGCPSNALLESVTEQVPTREVQRLVDVDDNQQSDVVKTKIETSKFYKNIIQIARINMARDALFASPKIKGNLGDIDCFTGYSSRIPFSIKGLFPQTTSIEKNEECSLHVLSMKFLPLVAEIRLSIIRYISERVETDKDAAERKKNRSTSKTALETRAFK